MKPLARSLATPGIVASLLLTFTISFDEFVLAFFLGGYRRYLATRHHRSIAALELRPFRLNGEIRQG